MGYHLPTNTSYVSDSWQGHINRNPPSTEPGTDYGSGSGSPLYAVGNGRVFEVKTTSSGAMGRFIAIDLDDGRRTRSLHLSAISVSAGQRVSRGAVIGRTGASAYGSDWGVGAHVHQTLWPGWYYKFGCCPPYTIDFAKYVGNEPVPPKPPDPVEDDEMANTGYSYPRSSDGVTVFGIINTDSGYNSEWSGTGGAYNNAMAAAFRTGSFVAITQAHRNALVNSLTPIRPQNNSAALNAIAESIADLDDDEVQAAVEAQAEAPTPVFDAVARQRQG
jgi:murein DD-endopeptidase MepM/ murein hydrolase activator NlpD